MTIYGLPPRDQRGYHDLASAGHIILTPTQPVGARTVLGCVSNPRPLGHGAKPLPTELSRPPFVQRKRIAHKSKKAAAATDSSTPSTSTVDVATKNEHDVLKQFDLTLEYGPCIGISRLDRWERAERHGLQPPKEVKDLINSHASDPLYTECLWNDYNTLK
ncbi:DNA polymerase delta subunit 4-like [Elysia marginata]|uniref:DNA polymerase delta subunit 4-like n=1 Tax=Elysia marginata TaxID=1093978 RepID=A0AAV4FL39_9GAST|nr:DNA polymerase delta subunit 4-like [Elysia marginata]